MELYKLRLVRQKLDVSAIHPLLLAKHLDFSAHLLNSFQVLSTASFGVKVLQLIHVDGTLRPDLCSQP